MLLFYCVGAQVSIDCSPESSVYAHVKRKFSGRVGVVIEAWNPVDGLPSDYRNAKVKFPKVGRRKEQEIDVNFDNLVPAGLGN